MDDHAAMSLELNEYLVINMIYNHLIACTTVLNFCASTAAQTIAAIAGVLRLFLLHVCPKMGMSHAEKRFIGQQQIRLQYVRLEQQASAIVRPNSDSKEFFFYLLMFVHMGKRHGVLLGMPVTDRRSTLVPMPTPHHSRSCMCPCCPVSSHHKNFADRFYYYFN